MNWNLLGKLSILCGTAVLCGVIAALFSDVAGANPVRVAALPVVVALLILLVADKRTLFYLIILLRSAGDPIFSLGKFDLGGASIGIGGALNGLVILIAALFMWQRPGVVPRHALAMWTGFLLVVLVAAIRSPVPGDSIRLFLVQLSYCAVFVIAFHMVQSRADLKCCIRVVLLSALVPILYASAQVATDLLAGSVGGMRINGTFSHANVFAFYLVLLVAVVMYVLKGDALRPSPTERRLLWLFVPVLLSFLLLTGTRSAWIACLLFFLLYGFFIQRRYLIYVAVALLVALLMPWVTERLANLASGNEFVQGGSLNSFAWRLSLWESALPWIKAKWLLGHGLESFLHYSPDFFRLDFFKRAAFGVGAHNTYLRLLFETGLIGLSSYLIVFGVLLFMLRQGGQSDRVGSTVSIIVVIAYLVISASDNMEYYLAFNWYFWFFLGLVCASRSVASDQEPQFYAAGTDARRASDFGRPPGAGPMTCMRLPSSALATRLSRCILSGFLFSCLLPEESSAASKAAQFCATLSDSAVSSSGWGSYRTPFSATSPWNSRPLSPVFGTYVIPKSQYFPSVAAGKWSTSVFLSEPGDRPVTVVGAPGRKGLWDPDAETFHDIEIPHWPSNVTPAAERDGHAEIVDPVTGIIHSFWKLRYVEGRWTAAQYAWTCINGRGFGDPAHYFQGARAAGVSTSAGLIRKHELTDGEPLFRHALAMSLTFNALSASPAYVFPATSADTNAATANSGQIPEGALLMLPPTFDTGGIANPALRKIAETLKVYGAYVVDRNFGTPFAIYVEIDSGFTLHRGGWDNGVARNLDAIRQALRQVVAVGGWADGNGRPYTPRKNMNLLSMRGPWRLISGSAPGTYDTWAQAVVFPGNSVRTEQVNATSRGLSAVSWAIPTAGVKYQLTAHATGGATLRLQIRDKATNAVRVDSGELGDRETASFVWPADAGTVAVHALSGVGTRSSVRGHLIRVDDN